MASDSAATDSNAVTSRRVGFSSSLVTEEASSNSTSFNRHTSPPSVRGTTAGGGGLEASYCPDDYDNMAGDDDDDRTQIGSGQRPGVRFMDLHSAKPGQRPSAPSTTPRTAIRSSEEESLDKLVAHLLGEVTPVSPVTPGQSATSGGHDPSSSGPGTSSSLLRWPQGDSLPRVELRRTVPAGAVSAVSSSGYELSADENDNLVKNVTVQRVVSEPPGSQVSAPADLTHSPPLPTIHKKTTPTAVANPVDVEIANDGGPLAELVSELNPPPGNKTVPNHSVRLNHSLEHQRNTAGEETAAEFRLPAQQLSDVGQSLVESRRRQYETDLDETRADRDPTSSESAACALVTQQSSLMDQFKALRLHVLTSTSELLSCVSGTWKRGESFRSKLTTIMQLCLALRTCVGRLESFLQSAMSTAAQSAANSPLVDAAITRIRNLHAVQTSIDAYIETLDREQLSGEASKRDLKVGGIIHLTKEIPGLVRTFAPVIEYLSDAAIHGCPITSPHQSDAVSETEVIHHIDTIADSEIQQQKEQRETITDEVDARLNLSQNAAGTSLITETVPSQNEQGICPDVQVQDIAMSTDKFVITQSAPTHNQQKLLFPMVSGSIVETISTTTHTDITPAISFSNAKNMLTVTNDTDHIGEDSESKSLPALPPVLPEKVESATPPTPPPKLRVALQYHASLGITNSLAASPSADVTATTSARTSSSSSSVRRDDDDIIATTSNLAAKLPAKQYTAKHNVVCASVDDRFQQTNWLADDRDGDSSERQTSTEIGYLTGCGEEIVAAADQVPFRFPRASQMTSTHESVVVLRRPAADEVDVDTGARHGRVSESELETPDFRASGVSQTTVEQLEALQRQAQAQAVVTHTDMTAGYERFDMSTSTSPGLYHQSTLSAEDRHLLMFYCDQMTGHWKVLDNAASAFFHCMDRRQAPKVFVSHSKFVIVAGHKMAYLGEVLARNVVDDNAKDWIVANSNRLCNSLKMAVRATKEAALAYPAVPAQQRMVDCIKEVTDWAIELKEVVDRLAYLGRPEHVLA